MASVGSREIPSREIAILLRQYFGEMLDDHAQHPTGKGFYSMFKLVHVGGRRDIRVSTVDFSLYL